MDANAEVLDMLGELAELTTLDEGSPQAFRVRAYENARRAVEVAPGEVTNMTVSELQQLDGIGKSTARKIRELLDTGKVAKLEALREAYPPSILALSRVPGLGPKAIAKLRAQLGVQGIDDLKQALAEQRVRGLAGFGVKSEAKLAKAIERLGLSGAERRTPIAAAMRVAQRVAHQLEALEQAQAVHICGSLRRLCETIGDVDLLVVASRPETVMDHFVALSMVDQILARGPTKTSVLTRRGLQIDLRIVPAESLGAARLYFTGSKAHNIKLRQRALGRGWTLNEYALKDAQTGGVVASQTEQEIYAALDMQWVPAPMREDLGEVERAADHDLPTTPKHGDLRGDLHVHTDLSGDGRSSLEEVIAAAAARGYRYLGITEHAEDLRINGVSAAQLLAQRDQLDGFRSRYPDLHLLQGCELNIGPDGQLDYDHALRMSLDWCVASVHSHFDLSKDQQTRRVLRAIADPSVKAIGHLSARMIGSRPGIEIDIDAVLRACADRDTAVELNSALARLDANVAVLRRAQQLGVTVLINSDAHHVRELDRVRWGVQQAERAMLQRDLVANTWEPRRFLSWASAGRSEVV